MSNLYLPLPISEVNMQQFVVPQKEGESGRKPSIPLLLAIYREVTCRRALQVEQQISSQVYHTCRQCLDFV